MCLVTSVSRNPWDSRHRGYETVGHDRRPLIMTPNPGTAARFGLPDTRENGWRGHGGPLAAQWRTHGVVLT